MQVYELVSYKKCSFIPITTRVKEYLRAQKAKDGICVVYCPHTTAGITINENADADVAADILRAMEEVVPKIHYAHFEGNSEAHIKTLMTGASVSIPVSNGEIMLGRWQGIYFCEYDGPRSRQFSVQFVGENY